ncbi:ankyrin-3-like [Strongylocentrotus purpuratus]|uniref:ZU5 domain-containing protein n=1 Tax=Strongylocentrotus purpuratus TaxID=7668 RepID=A0A7M7PFW8_STRPU|nr:ankyrin-3-like [Strongylocentrotus purpuratus]
MAVRVEDLQSALNSAAQNGQLDLIQELIGRGAEVNKVDNDAAAGGHLDVVTELIGQGADVGKASDKGWSALYLAAAAGRVRVSSALLSQHAELATSNIIHWTEFHTAAERGDLDAMKDQVSQGAELDKAGSFGWTALHIAASNGHLDMTKYLLSQRADVNSSNAFGRCALHSASEKGNLDVVEYLISKGADMNKVDDLGLTAIHFASNSGHLDIVKSLIGHGVEADNGNANGTTALHYALFTRRIGITKYLLSQGSELNKRGVSNSVILQFDGQYGHYDVVRCVQGRVVQAVSRLIDSLTVFRGAPEGDLGRSKYQDGDEDKTAQGGMVIVHLPCMISDLDIQDLLVSQGCRTVSRTSLQYAVEGGSLAVVRYLISQGADVNESNNVGWTALHIAAQMGHLYIVDYLLGQGAEVAKGVVDDISPLHVAAFVGHCDVTEHLLRRGAEVNGATKEKGSTALHVGVQNGHLEITNSLLSHGADVDATDHDGWTALHIAAQNGHIDVMKCLLQQLADVSKVTKKGSSALHLSAANGHSDVTRYLLEHGAEVNLSKPGQTALQLAAEQDQGHWTSPDTLCAEGQKHLSSPTGHADTEGLTEDEKKVIGQRAGKGCTSVHLATQNGYTSIIEILVSHGADLNIQSIDGQTCLHEAIRLSGRKDSQVEATPVLQKISEEFYQNELSPKKALVFYLLDHGAKPDIKDNQGNLPVHYAKDEIIRQMIFSRSPAMDIIKAYRAGKTAPPVINDVSVQVGCDGKELKLEHHGIAMSIPPGAVEQNESCKITLTLVRDLPSVDIQDDTSMAAYGIRCDPPNMVFHQPVKIMIPHSTLFINPEDVIPDIVSHIWDTRKGLPRVSRTKSSAAPDKLPYCKILERHLELHIDHCAEWWVLIPLEQQIIQLQFMCTPYVPDKIERGKEFDVHLHLNADIPGIEMEVQREEKQSSYHNAHRSFPISIEAKSGDISVTCDGEGKMSNTEV